MKSKPSVSVGVMLAQSHLNKYQDVIKHKKIYKRIKVTGTSKEQAKLAALKYFENLGFIELFREVAQVGNVCEYEGIVVSLG